MKKLILITLIALLTGFQLSAQKKTKEEKVQDAIWKFFHGIEQYDYDAIRDACTDDFVIFENGVKMSCEDFIGFIKNYENMGASDMNYQLDHFTTEIKGRNAWVTLDNRGSGRLGEQKLEFNWLESAILQKEKGQWKIAFYHSTEKPKPKPDLEKEQAEAEKCLDNFVKAFNQDDSRLLEDLVASGDDLIMISTGKPHWRDHASFMSYNKNWMNMVENNRFIVERQAVHPDPTGKYARFYQILTMEGVLDNKPFKTEHARTSGLLEKREGKWKLVQLHGSVPERSQNQVTTLSDKQKAAIVEEVEKAFDTFAQSIRDLDEETFMNCIALDEGFIHCANGKIYNTEKFCKNIHQSFTTLQKVQKMDFSDLQIKVLSPSAAVLSTRFIEEMISTNEEPLQVQGASMYVYERMDDDWKIVQMGGSHLFE